tara:strand:- start:301 stop:1149 length:849 start_codon:yes stop_codon:yes gene_type:complete
MNLFNFLYDSINQILIQIFLGIVQGLTEFLPISSTAHLIAIPIALGLDEPNLSVIASLQLGSIASVIFYFWSDLRNIGIGFYNGIKHDNWSDPNTTLATSVFIGTIPIICVGIFIKLFWHGYESSFLRSIPAVGIVSIIMSLLLALSEIYGSRKINLKNINNSYGSFVGLSQVLALIPGVSRSGITITSAMLIGFDRSSAARFSFLLGIPAISISGIIEFNEIVSSSSFIDVFPLIFGVISSAITSWFAIDFLINFLKSNSTKIFIYYRLAFGVFLLVNWYL